jgi:phospholipid/cholesterol/gamma-HCH transport system permease protein
VHTSTFTVERQDGTLYLGGELRLTDAAPIWDELQRLLAPSTPALTVDFAAAKEVDSSIVALLVDLRAALHERGVEVDFANARKDVAELISIYGGFAPPAGRPQRPRLHPLEYLGLGVRRVGRGAHRAIEFVGETVTGAWGALKRPVTGNWRSTFALVARAGTDAIPLVLALNFLLGFVMGYESSRQLEKYGAESFIADVVGVAVTRELSPVMTSVIVIGRSGAAYAAELGTMKVSDELDALRTMGFVPIRHLVVPRVLALTIVTPVLTLIGDVAGVIGGMLVATTRLGVGVQAYLTELKDAVFFSDVLGGLLKASVAGFAIAMIGVQQGLATQGGPAGVGTRTTASVVRSLVAIVFIDAFFALLLKAIGT